MLGNAINPNVFVLYETMLFDVSKDIGVYHMTNDIAV